MNDALVITNFALVIVTAGLVLVTWLYVRHTKRMADIMSREFEFRISPVIELIGIGREGLSLKPIIIKNLGFYPIFLQEVELDWWYKKNEKKHYSKKRDINKLLDKGKEEIAVLDLSERDFQNEDYPESLNLHGVDIGRETSGKIYLFCKDVSGVSHKIELETLDCIVS